MLDGKKLYSTIGSLIRQARRANGFTQDKLSQQLGLTRTSLSNFERGRQHVQIHTLYQIAQTLEVPIRDLLPEVQLVIGQSRNTSSGEDKHILKQLLGSQSEKDQDE